MPKNQKPPIAKTIYESAEHRVYFVNMLVYDADVCAKMLLSDQGF